MSEDMPLMEVERNERRARIEAIQAIQGEMGWRWFIAEVSQETDNALELLAYANGEQEIGRLQGRIDAFRQILAFEDTIDLQLAALEEEPDADV